MDHESDLWDNWVMSSSVPSHREVSLVLEDRHCDFLTLQARRFNMTESQIANLAIGVLALFRAEAESAEGVWLWADADPTEAAVWAGVLPKGTKVEVPPGAHLTAYRVSNTV
jgi:hypothetical protein